MQEHEGTKTIATLTLKGKQDFRDIPKPGERFEFTDDSGRPAQGRVMSIYKQREGGASTIIVKVKGENR